MKPPFTWSQIAGFRLARTHLTRESHPEPATVCQDVCGVQAQVMSAAEMAFWARTPHLARQEIHSALWEKRTLIKTSCMRQTLHVIPTADFFIYINALKRSRMAALMRIMSKFGITQRQVDDLNEAVMESLQDGAMTQRELTERVKPKVARNVRTWMEKVWSAFKPALAQGLICYGPQHGRAATFVRADRWLLEQEDVPEQEAKQTLLRRYLTGYAPATHRDFAKWSGMPAQEARDIWTSLKDDLLEIQIEGETAFILLEDEHEFSNRDPGKDMVRLLPGFDPYLLAHARKRHLVDESYYKRVYRNQGWISPVVLIDGRVKGCWSLTRRANRVLVQIEPFEKFSQQVCRLIEKEAATLANFLETQYEITFSTSG